MKKIAFAVIGVLLALLEIIGGGFISLFRTAGWPFVMAGTLSAGLFLLVAVLSRENPQSETSLTNPSSKRAILAWIVAAAAVLVLISPFTAPSKHIQLVMKMGGTCSDTVRAPSFMGFRKSEAIDLKKSDSYYYFKGCIFYSTAGNTFELGSAKMSSAQAATFEVLSKDYAKDAKQAYYKNSPIQGVDLRSFTVYQGIARDADHIILFGRVLGDSHAHSFKRLGLKDDFNKRTTFYKDRSFLYLVDDLGKTFTSVPLEDAHSLKMLTRNYLVDKKTAYYGTSQIQGADLKSFEVIDFDTHGVKPTVVGADYARDKNYVYHEGKILSGADPRSFKVLEYGGTSVFYGKDKNGCYSPTRSITDKEGHECVVIQ